MISRMSRGAVASVRINVTSNTSAINVKNAVGARYSKGKTRVTLNISPGATLYGAANGGFALDSGDGWNAGDRLILNVFGYIQGAGGEGGLAGYGRPCPPHYGWPGGNAGHALRTRVKTMINNGSGYIYGGGGGGGGGGAYTTLGLYGGGGGGGGAGFPAGGPGYAYGGNGGSPGYHGAGGSKFTPGGGGAGGEGSGGAGGTGGNLGSPGNSGGASTSNGGGGGGAAGKSIDGISYVTFISGGSRIAGSTV